MSPTNQPKQPPSQPALTGEQAVEVVDDSFRAVLTDRPVLRPIAEGLKFTEGPTWVPAQGCLIFSDIPADTIYQWRPDKGLSVWRQPSRNANGNTVDALGRVVTCEHGSRTVTRTEADGEVVTLAATCNGRKLNSPNDVVVKADGSIWFTDPPYGIKPQQMEQPACHVFRLDDGAADPAPVTAEMNRPNGLCFSPDEKFLYVANSDPKDSHVRRYRVTPGNALEDGRSFAAIAPGVPDGMRTDRDGRLYVTAGDGVQVFSPEGKLLGRIRTPEPAANCAFGGPDGRTLFITARKTVWAIDLAVAGCRGLGRRPNHVAPRGPRPLPHGRGTPDRSLTVAARWVVAWSRLRGHVVPAWPNRGLGMGRDLPAVSWY